MKKTQAKNADLKLIIITIRTRNKDGNKHNNNKNNENNNPFRLVCSQSFVNNQQTEVIFKQKTQETFRTLIKEKPAS